MKISLNWLTDYVDVSMPAVELGRVLTRIGLNCEQIIETSTDVVLDLEVTSNRPDCLGHLGVARELAAATGAAFRPPAPVEPSTAGKVADLAGVEVLAAALCPRYTARLVRNVRVGPSPDWLVERIEAVGLRSINNVVDASNYVLMEYSQPLHSFDFARLAGGRIVVRRAADGETLVSIDETTCRLDPDMLVIADAEKPVAIAGVMGGLNTEVTERTKDVLIESAQFDPSSVRRTSRKLGLTGESNFRFERGVDPVGVDAASLRACLLIIELAGGELAAGVVDVWAHPYEPPEVAMRPERCGALLGIDVAASRQVQILDSLGLAPRRKGGRILCAIPPHRADLRQEVDLIEEIGRMEGYDTIPVAEKVTHGIAGEALGGRVRRQIGRAMSAAGFNEAITFSFIDEHEAAMFGAAGTVRVDAAARRTRNTLRTSLVPSLLRACKTNQDAGSARVSLYELASVFRPGAADGLPEEYLEVALVTTRDLRELRGAVEALAEQIIPSSRPEVVACEVAGLSDGAAAEIRLDGERAGVMGLVAPRVQGHYGLEHAVAAATVRFDAIVSRAGRTRTYAAVAKFPPVRRDLSLIVDEAVTWRALREAVEAVLQPLRTAVEYVTTYRGKPIRDGAKSITVRLEYRSGEGTLRSEQVDAEVAEVVRALREQLAAELRE